jgi:SsrA-binding protein
MNRKVNHDYFFLKDYVAGIQLLGTEVKAIRAGKVSLVDSYCYFYKKELFLKGAHIAVTEDSYTHEPFRERKLLLKKIELKKLEKDLNKGLTIIVRKIFSNDRNYIKAEISLAKGKQNFDKRKSLKNKDQQRELKRSLTIN